MSDRPFHRVFLSDGVKELLPRGMLRQRADELAGCEIGNAEASLVVELASALLASEGHELPKWTDAETRYLVVADVAEPALLRLPAVLALRKPHLRLHVARDSGVVKRIVLAQSRSESWEGIVDAYILGNRLVLVLGDMSIREFPKERLPKVKRMGQAAFEAFVIDEFGSFLHWASGDVHLGPSQLLQAVDPMYLTDIEIRRYAKEKISLALSDMRCERGLKQTDIVGLSERHVRRLEKEEVRLTVDAAERLAEAFGLDISAFLAELGTRLSALTDSDEVSEFPVTAVAAG